MNKNKFAIEVIERKIREKKKILERTKKGLIVWEKILEEYNEKQK